MPGFANSRASPNNFVAASPLRPSLPASIEYQPVFYEALDKFIERAGVPRMCPGLRGTQTEADTFTYSLALSVRLINTSYADSRS
jgi:hypothetical protein